MRIGGRLVTLASGAGESAIEAREARFRNGRSVYFIKSGDLVKIGWSDAPSKRLGVLSTGSIEKLELLAVLPGDRYLERFLHECFASLHARGEWFHYCGKLRTMIGLLIKAGKEAA